MLDGLQGGFQIGAAGHEDDGNVGVALAHRAQELDAGDARHADVGEDRVVAVLLEHAQGGLAVLRDFDLESIGTEGSREDAAQPLVIVGEQEARVAHAISAKVRGAGLARWTWFRPEALAR